MKTDRIYAETPETVIEMKFNRNADHTEDEWLQICRKHCFSDEIIRVYDANTHHLCKYCGRVAKGIDPDRLCAQCQDDFGHSFFDEL